MSSLLHHADECSLSGPCSNASFAFDWVPPRPPVVFQRGASRHSGNRDVKQFIELQRQQTGIFMIGQREEYRESVKISNLHISWDDEYDVLINILNQRR
uniref:Uncharacterized protein n=1 Tax=Cryptomonas paramaecium TaxID=2898 RepID=A0A7S4PT31_9CRYP